MERRIIFSRVKEETWWKEGLFSLEYRKRPGGEEDYFPPSLGRDLVERRIIFPSEYRKRPSGEEDFFPPSIGRDLVEWRIIFPRV